MDEQEESIEIEEDDIDEEAAPKKPKAPSMKKKLTQEEKDRLIEILVYHYFNDKKVEVLQTQSFWTMINTLCQVHKVDPLSISKSIRILSAKENTPEEEEEAYLFGSIGMTVRPIYKVSGVYWQKQKELREKFMTTPPTVRRRILDIVMKKSLRDFLFAMYDMFGILNWVDIRLLEEAIK